MESNAFLSEKESKPLTTCQHCKERPCIKTGEICKDVEKLLKKVTSSRKEWETRVDPRWFDTYTQTDKVLIKGKHKGKEEALYISTGRRKKPLHSEE